MSPRPTSPPVSRPRCCGRSSSSPAATGSLAHVTRSHVCLLALCAAVLIAGCGDSDETTPAPTVTVQTSPTEPEALEESTAPVPPDDSAGTPEEADDPGADRPRTV